MSINSKAAIAACFATLFIISGTAALAHNGAPAIATAQMSGQI